MKAGSICLMVIIILHLIGMMILANADEKTFAAGLGIFAVPWILYLYKLENQDENKEEEGEKNGEEGEEG